MKGWKTVWKWTKYCFHPLFILLASVILWVEHNTSDASYLPHLWQAACAMALFIWIQVVWMLLFRPFRLDKQLSDTGIMKLIRVAAVVIAVPVLITCVIMWCQQDEARARHAAYAHDLIYEGNLYGAGDVEPVADSLETADPASLSYLKAAHPQTAAQEPPSLFWSVIYHFTDPGNQHMSSSANGRGWAFLIAMLGVIFMGGFLITTLVNWIEQRTRKFEDGLQRYGVAQYLNQSVILFIGSHPILQYTIDNILKDKQRSKGVDYFVILTSAKIDEVRNQLFSAFPEEVTNRIILYSGSTTDPEQLNTLPYRSVREIYLLGEHDGKLHDVHNVECMNFLSEKLQWPIAAWRLAKKEPVPCHVLFEFQSTFSVFQSSDSASVKNHIEFIPYNYYELWAQHVVMGNTVNGIAYEPIEGKNGLTEQSNQYLHMFVVGMSNMGIAMASEVATMAHYPNYKQQVEAGADASENPNNRTRITFLDKNMSEEMQFFMSRHKVLFQLSRWRFANLGVTKDSCETLSDLNYFSNHTWEDERLEDGRVKWPWHNYIEEPGTPFHHLLQRKDNSVEPNFMDVEWQFLQGGVEDAAVQNYLRAEAQNDRVRLIVAICLPDDVQSAAAALYLPEEVLLQAERVLVYQKGGKDLLHRFAVEKDKLNKVYEKLLPFGMLGDCAIQYPQLEFAQYLACAYGINIEISQKENSAPKMNIYDRMKEVFYERMQKNPRYAEEEWMNTRMWTRWSNIYNAMHVLFKLRSMGLSLEQDEETLKTGLGVDRICFSEECVRRGEKEYRCYDIDTQASYYKLAEVEHNRWSIEKLFMGYRPLFAEDRKEDKEALKANFVHLNLCGFDKLQETDLGVIDYDVAFVVAIPIIKGILARKHKA